MKLKQNKQSKLVIALSAVILLLVALSATLTFAYFTAKDDKTSGTIEFGNLKISANSFDIANADTHTLVPGCKIKLTGGVSTTADTDVEAYVRIKFDVEVGTVTDGNFTAIKTIYDTQIADFVTKLGTALGVDWAKADDGYFYLTKSTQGTADESVLSFGENSTIAVPTSLDNIWQGKAVQIKMTVQAIQADHITYTVKAESESEADREVEFTVSGETMTTAEIENLAKASAWTAAGSQANAE